MIDHLKKAYDVVNKLTTATSNFIDKEAHRVYMAYARVTYVPGRVVIAERGVLLFSESVTHGQTYSYAILNKHFLTMIEKSSMMLIIKRPTSMHQPNGKVFDPVDAWITVLHDNEVVVVKARDVRLVRNSRSSSP